ncbi:UDP-forming cellulose synthase catalytic subunit [Paraburkholderia susongensis]|uniref:Cellulose synthase catalytic subunit [UDP-forming] n=1 Tax=Paraburkholderia susongensis TaxID=1515439 RepID=A0A1X7LR81_9BURK|nr:UDP-forming cellulose synthase catalytic subunit [Paraburkholderia susongensis]SMG56378.1 cellulose synthase (UDP-forming) [Paraburkholderia susongensis]
MNSSRSWLRAKWDACLQAVRASFGLGSDATLHAWLVRLVFRPPRPGKPDLPMLWSDRLTRYLAAQLGIGLDHRWNVWLWRFVFRTRFRRPRFAADLRKLHRLRERRRRRRAVMLRWLAFLAAPFVWLLGLLWRPAARRLEAVDWEALTARIEDGAAAVDRVPYLRYLVLVAALIIGIVICTTPMTLGEQTRLFALVVVTVLLVRRVPGRLATLMMAGLSLLMAGRYIWWRTTQTLHLPDPLDAVIGYVLYAAEFYTWVVLLLGYIQTAWPLNRKACPLPEDRSLWPDVDVYIPTYNEPLSVVQPTVYAAAGMDWPRDKLHVHLLDDGTREEFRRFAEEAGVGYIVRSEHTHAKAGNINHALTCTHAPYIAIFDCDHIPVRSFLQTTMGQFLADPKCALVQTPHHFFSPDPFERNFDTFHRVPNEGSLFYGLIQDGNDFWNATFFCGSCAVIKRAPLEEVGGIAVETVTEDCHTALRLHRLGYNSAYLRTVQAAGLATESLSGHIGQRIRWARGMAQIFRVDNPWLGKGLSFFQRICYANAMLHFFYGIPRLVFLLMPGAYLFFGLHMINTQATVILAYVLPYLITANLANSRIQGQFRHSFWAEVYESVLAWYIILPTTMALINPKLGKFNVTAKGGQIYEGYLDWAISKPYLVLLGINAAAMLAGMIRIVFLHSTEPQTSLMNMVWAAINMIVLGAAVGVAQEARQVRVSHHIPLHVPATLLLPDGRTLACMTINYSIGGLGLELPPDAKVSQGERVGVCLARGHAEHHFPGVIVRAAARSTGIRLELTPEAERQLIQCTFGRADAWIGFEKEPPQDVPLYGLREVIGLGIQGHLRLIDACVEALERLVMRRKPRQQ